MATATTVTYRQLADGTDRVSALLWQRGIRKGDRVAFLGENSPEFLAGALRRGAARRRLRADQHAPGRRPRSPTCSTDSGARVLIHDPEFAARVAGAAGANVVARDRRPAKARRRARALAAAPAAPGGHADADVTLDDPAAILYTSGTTGKAKGAVLTHENLTWVALNCLVDYDVVSTDVALMISPLFHAASLGMGALPVILKGATIVLEKGFEPGAGPRAHRAARRDDAERGADDVPAAGRPPATGRRTDLSTLQKLTCGGSAVPTRILNAYEERGLSFSQGYGMTETSPGATSLSPAMTRAKQGSVGPAALLHRRAHRRRARSDGAARHGGRDRDRRPERLPGLPRTSPRRPRPPSRPTAGSARATWATSTPTATCTSPTG